MKTNKSTPVVLASVMLAVCISSASARPDTRYMSCGQAKSIVQASGAVVLSTGAHTYAKFVKNHAYCNLNEDLKRAFVPTQDTRRCKIGFRCVDKTLFED